MMMTLILNKAAYASMTNAHLVRSCHLEEYLWRQLENGFQYEASVFRYCIQLYNDLSWYLKSARKALKTVSRLLKEILVQTRGHQ